VTCKLSGARTDPARASDLRPYYETVLAASYGQVCDLYQELTAQLSPAEQDAIFDRNARRVYRLP
jgi:hypothetical protein